MAELDQIWTELGRTRRASGPKLGRGGQIWPWFGQIWPGLDQFRRSAEFGPTSRGFDHVWMSTELGPKSAEFGAAPARLGRLRPTPARIGLHFDARNREPSKCSAAPDVSAVIVAGRLIHSSRCGSSFCFTYSHIDTFRGRGGPGVSIATSALSRHAGTTVVRPNSDA